MKNRIFLEDCRKTLDRSDLEYDYVWTGLPDYAEIGLTPVKDDDKYIDFLTSILSNLKPRNGLVTLFATDRKFNSTIIPRHSMMASIMKGLGHKMRSHKIWVKTTKINLFRLTYAHIITYGNGKMQGEKAFKYDVFQDKPEKDPDAQPSSLIEKCILNHTKPAECVYDPCIGLGNTAVAAFNTGRKFVGSEIDATKHAACVKRLRALGATVN